MVHPRVGGSGPRAGLRTEKPPKEGVRRGRRGVPAWGESECQGGVMQSVCSTCRCCGQRGTSGALPGPYPRAALVPHPSFELHPSWGSDRWRRGDGGSLPGVISCSALAPRVPTQQGRTFGGRKCLWGVAYFGDLGISHSLQAPPTAVTHVAGAASTPGKPSPSVSVGLSPPECST
ncbi:hypothetical protein GWK47_031495 [Chionoecetes opilio]|uniref:Uncharacterized protein n=1 Tax=Chionoecetes opilio TaxID=41210 RepID=A0A8J4Z0W5_CHIOP|nr:hypothetical protein GWK47_031495 [Chionoecetes opilio]